MLALAHRKSYSVRVVSHNGLAQIEGFKMNNRYKVGHSNKNKPGMSHHIFALIDTHANNQIIKEDTDLHELMEECTLKNTIIELPCECGRPIKMSKFHYRRLREDDDVICDSCERGE